MSQGPRHPEMLLIPVFLDPESSGTAADRPAHPCYHQPTVVDELASNVSSLQDRPELQVVTNSPVYHDKPPVLIFGVAACW